MKRIALLLSAALLVLLAGCAGVPFEATELVPTVPRSAAELADGLWSRQRAPLVLRHSALFEWQGMRVPVEAMLSLDTKAGEARLVAMNEMGVKLYDITVLRDGSRANFVMPDLARYPGFAEAVALSVRRIFLAPAAAADDRLTVASRSYQTSREEGSATLRFTFGGAEAQLLEKSCRGADQSWRVRYYRYQRRDGILFPGGIVLDDDRAGYRLTLWIDSVEPSNE
ncbi:DUF3261 domain-containing protein [Geomonas paludis]|uniref:DUF3261 domain-containing protein n=1 Tax=Geomonas paludis TaxID=2740185 RepID=A0A6V8MRC9_9BACT|nr:DUF3261 domain-containing protein [Geomonas paludis]UPU36051.1 DUF3261 domain-containing protein [Geomonas paludis]GFO62357.1 hypothetical protein GMPD_02760 [Geomonas paludis]